MMDTTTWKQRVFLEITYPKKTNRCRKKSRSKGSVDAELKHQNIRIIKLFADCLKYLNPID